jgi:two-component system, OmpR family, sensor kinase
MSSLRTRLFVGLAAFILVTGVAAGVFMFRWAFDEAIELQDAILLQVGALAAASRPQTELALQGDVDSEARVVVEELGRPQDTPSTEHSLLPLPADIIDGLHTIGRGSQQWRILVRTRADGSRVAVGQLTAYRNEIASGSALRTVWPFAVLVPGLMLLIGVVISQSFRPVSRLAATLDAGKADHPTELPLDGMPEELRPFIESINRLLRRIGTMLGQQRRFIADAAHELRSPITALSVQAENLAHADLPPDSRARLAVLQTGIRRVAHLLEQLLALARYESSGGPHTEVAAFDRVARGVIADLLPFAQARGVDLGFGRIESIVVRGDATALAVVIRNLVDNALRHAAQGGRVDIHLYREGTRAVLRVEDSGPGICEQELARVFEPFYRGRRNRGEGTGLGLSIVHRILTNLSGSIALENIAAPQGPGLRAVVTIPLAARSGGGRQQTKSRGEARPRLAEARANCGVEGGPGAAPQRG